MVEDRAIERLSCGSEFAGYAAIAVAQPRIPAGLVVSKHVGEDFAKGEIGAGFVAAVAGQAETMCLVVDLQAFAPWIFFGEASCKEMLRGAPTVEFQREFATLIPTSNPPWRWLLKAHQNSVGCDAKMDQPAPLGCRQ